jgi:predicted nucleic acid-binding Zn ribbon protein
MTGWRPLPGRPAEREAPRLVAESLDRMARRFGAPRASVLSAVFARWDEIVGASVAAHVHPQSLRRGVLVIATEQPAWASQMRFLVPELLRRLAEVAGDDTVERVEIRVVTPGSHDRSGGRIW